MKFSIIAAIDRHRGIGIRNKLPWRLRGDLEHFREVTVGQGKNAVIMGRTTWESLPERHRPLAERVSVVLSRSTSLQLPQGVVPASSLGGALQELAGRELDDIFVIGGANVYAQAASHPACQKFYLTEVDAVFDCDTFFPELPAGFGRTAASPWQEEAGLRYRFAEYELAA